MNRPNYFEKHPADMSQANLNQILKQDHYCHQQIQFSLYSKSIVNYGGYHALYRHLSK
jgi:hypothetical protein